MLADELAGRLDKCNTKIVVDLFKNLNLLGIAILLILYVNNVLGIAPKQNTLSFWTLVAKLTTVAQKLRNHFNICEKLI